MQNNDRTASEASSLNYTPGGLPPIASFSYSPVSPTPEETITFDASTSFDPDGWIVRFTWDFGEGNVTTVTNPIVTHAYPLDGNYTVQLTVTDNSGSTGVASAIIQVSTVVFFRVVILGTLIPISNVKVTVYYKYGSTWKKAPVGPHGLEIKYDIMTQPDLANTYEERYRNPGYTASILRHDSSNIGFDVHPSTWTVFFKFEWGPYVAYWPNDTTRVYTYEKGLVEAHDYSPCHRARWDAAAGTYVIGSSNIPKDSVDPTETHPIIVGIAGLPPTQKYYLTVRTNPIGITTIPGEGWYIKDTNVTLTAPTNVPVSADTQYRFDYWDVDGPSKGAGVNPIIVRMDANHTATAHYIKQYLVTFNQTGLLSDATGTVVTVDGAPKTLGDFPFTKWIDNGGSVTYSYTSTVPSSISGKQYVLSSVSDPSSPITVTSPVTVTGNYVAQYSVSFAQTGLDSTATGTVVTVNGDAKTYVQLTYTIWANSGSTVTYSYNDPVPSSVSGKRFRLDSVSGPISPITVSESTTVTGNYVTQFSVTFSQTGLDATATGTVVTINGSPKTYIDLTPYFTLWVDSGSSVTYSYNDIVFSTVTGKRFKQVSVSGPASPISVNGPKTVAGTYKTQFYVTFDQSGVGNDFTGTVVTIDGTVFSVSMLPNSSWWDKDSTHTFSFATPLVVDATKQYNWSSTSGLSNARSGTLTVTVSGSVIGNYIVANRITFDQVGAGSDFTGTAVVIDGVNYKVENLSVSFMWAVNSVHTFAFQSPLVVSANAKQYVWTSTTGLSNLQSGSITVTTYGSIIGHYKTQYYLILATNPPSVASPSGAGWYDEGTFASVSTPATVNIVPGSSRYSFTGWTTAHMPEIINPSSPSTTVLMDRAKTVTANYVIQYSVVFNQSGVGSDFTGTVVTIDGTDYTVSTLPTPPFWWNSGSSHAFSFASPLVVDASKSYDWVSTTGLSTLQSGTLTITGSGSVTGNYVVHTKCQITFDTTGLGGDAIGTVVTIDSVNYGFGGLPVSFWWDTGSSHTYSFTLVIDAGLGKRYVLANVTGLSTLPSDTIIISGSGSITGNYKTQFYLTLATNPPGVDSPLGEGWYDAGTNASISTDAFVDIPPPDTSRYRFNGWATDDMVEIEDSTRSPTKVLMDKAKTVTANYATQYKVTFRQSGVGSDFTGTIVTVDGTGYLLADPLASFWWDKDTVHNFEFHSPLVVTPSAKQYVWTSTTGLSTLQSGSITVSAAGSVTGNYKTQYYFTVSPPSPDSPTPASGWFDAGTSITASVTSPWPGTTGVQYVCTGWTGTGSVPASGSTSSTTFTINAPSSIAWNWKTQYYLTVRTSPSGIVAIPGEGWYDVSASVSLTAPPITGFNFVKWDLDGVSQGAGVATISVTMNAPHTATAFYTPIQPPPAVAVGGYSVSLAKPTPTPAPLLVVYIALIALFGTAISLFKRKRKW